MKVIASPPVNNRLQLAIEFPRDGLRMKSTPTGVVLSLPDCRVYGEPGAPQLPRATVRVALPVGTDVVSIEISAKRTVIVSAEPLFLAPVQPHRPGSEFSERPPRRIRPLLNVDRRAETPDYLGFAPSSFVAPKQVLYTRALEKPHPLACHVVTHQVSPYPVAVVELNPLRFQRDGSLELTTHFEVTLMLHPARREKKKGGIFASQVSRAAGIVRRSVVNPEIVVDMGSTLGDMFRLPTHLIITNDKMAAAFEKLSKWKTSRGVVSRVITIEQIRNNKYGDFNKGARDDQERIRNFLRWALENWGIQWVLLGGDINIVPIRMAASMGSYEIQDDVDVDNPSPYDPVGHWTDSFLMVDCNRWWFEISTNNILLRMKDNTIIPYDDGSSSTTTPGWYFTTDCSGSTRSLSPSMFVRVNGSEDAVRRGLRFLQRWNTIPTDYYYSSLSGYPSDIAHDWDLLNNGIYGLAALKEDGHVDIDSIRWTPDVSVGRAPVETVIEAENFVNKVIAYEKFCRPDGTRLDSTGWPHRMLVVSSNWAGRWYYERGGENPPLPNKYHHSDPVPWTMLHLDYENGAIGAERRLLVQVNETDVREIPYVETVELGGRGWHFAKSSTDPTASVFDFVHELPTGKRWHVHIPRLTEWIAVYGADDELTPERYILDTPTLDESAHDQEMLRKQVAHELPWLTELSRLYEDLEDLPVADIAAAPLAVLTKTNLKDALNIPPHIVSLSGHGNPRGGVCGLDVNLAGDLNNGYHTFITYADSCLTNAFDENDSMGEMLVRNGKGGALAYIGNTRFSWIGIGDDLQREFFRRHAGERHLGMLNDSRCDFLGNVPSNWQYRWALMSLNLTGDPETPVWTDNPGVIIVKKPQKLPRKAFQIEVLRRRERFQRPPRWCWPEEPAPDVIVHVKVDDFEQWAITDKDGRASFDLSGAPLGEAVITASAQGYIPQVAQSAVVGPLWVEGRVVRAQVGHGPAVEVRIAIDWPEGTTEIGLTIDSATPEGRLIFDTMMRSHASPQKVWFYLDELADGQKIQRLAIGDAPPS